MGEITKTHDRYLSLVHAVKAHFKKTGSCTHKLQPSVSLGLDFTPMPSKVLFKGIIMICSSVLPLIGGTSNL